MQPFVQLNRLLVISLLLARAISLTAGLTGHEAPGQVHNLSGWQLDTCLHSPRIVKALELATYTDRNFFLANDSSIVMVTPDNATAVTAHADHPRTELREVGVADWKFDGGVHTLSLLTTVQRVSNTTQETIIAQIHGSVDEEIAKVVKLRWTRGRVEARVKNKTMPHAEFGLDCGKYVLGTSLAVKVRVAAGMLQVVVNGNAVNYTPPFNPNDRFYFKAGDYNQCGAVYSLCMICMDVVMREKSYSRD